jgi:indolepyruvate ferredoxin oxidoreductase beta subunit
MRDPFNILIAGVGGQGNLLCGRVLAYAAVRSGLRPVVGDTFGASRRGGSVLTHLRIGKRDWAPLIPKGEVDFLLGLEPLEALRAAGRYAGNRTIAIVSQTKIPTVATTGEESEYPSIDQVNEALRGLCKQVILIDAEDALWRIGSTKMLNSYVLGVLESLDQTPIGNGEIRNSLLEIFGAQSPNIQAFEEGTRAIG